jgi:hypothetical protein
VAGFYEQAARLNPYMAEPHLMLAQLHVQAGRWQEGEQEARQALQLFLDWGTQYDKVGLLVTGRGRVLVSSVCVIRAKRLWLSGRMIVHQSAACTAGIMPMGAGTCGNTGKANPSHNSIDPWPSLQYVSCKHSHHACCCCVHRCCCLFLQRMEWGAWVAWTRVVLDAALQQTWAQKEPLEVLSKGLVGGL